MSPRRKAISDVEDEWAFLTEPPKSVRTYDSTLSKPGKMCPVCRNFVAGGLQECHVCWTVV